MLKQGSRLRDLPLVRTFVFPVKPYYNFINEVTVHNAY